MPAKFRQETGKTIIIARWYDGGLVIVGKKGWNNFLERLARPEDVLTKPIRLTERFLFSTAYEMDLDEQGRFVLPTYLREEAGISLGDKIIFLGLGERIELWNRIIWEEEEKKVKSEADKMLETIAKERKNG